MAYTFYGKGTPNNPQAGDVWLNPDGSLNSMYTMINGVLTGASGGYFSTSQVQAALQAAKSMTAGGAVASPSIVSYQSATVAYDSNGNYVNPQTGAIYGKTPPTGSWPSTLDPTYNSYVTNALAAQGLAQTSSGLMSTNAAQSQPTQSVQGQSNTATAPSNAPVASDTTVNSGSLSNLLTPVTNFFSSSPLLGLGALALVVLMFMGGGGEGKHARY